MDRLFVNHENPTEEEIFFSNVVGYPEIKKLLLKAIVVKEPIHILLSGPPSSSKTVFLLELLGGLHYAYFVDAVGASGAGMVDYLCLHMTLTYCLLDELDKIGKGTSISLPESIGVWYFARN